MYVGTTPSLVGYPRAEFRCALSEQQSICSLVHCAYKIKVNTEKTSLDSSAHLYMRKVALLADIGIQIPRIFYPFLQRAVFKSLGHIQQVI